MFASVVALLFAGLVAAQSCSRTYTVKEGDYCDLISANMQVPTYQLAVSNYKTINDGCTNLEIGQNLCLGYTGQDCHAIHIVKQGDYCDLIASTYGLNTTMLRTNNPQIDDKCYNLYVGEVLCVADKSTVTPPPSGWTLPGSSLGDDDFTDNTNDVVHTTTTPHKASVKTTTTSHKASTKTTTTAPHTTTTKASSTKTQDNADGEDDCTDY